MRCSVKPISYKIWKVRLQKTVEGCPLNLLDFKEKVVMQKIYTETIRNHLPSSSYHGVC